MLGFAWCSEFDQKVRQSKLEADEALTKIPEIERMINSAEQMTREARDSLEGAERDANAARELAELAKNVAENADRVKDHFSVYLPRSLTAKRTENFLAKLNSTQQPAGVHVRTTALVSSVNWAMTLTFLGHVTSSMTSSFDPPYTISY